MKTGSRPICPQCEEEMPVPGIQMDVYECPFCGGKYKLKWTEGKEDFERVYGTEVL